MDIVRETKGAGVSGNDRPVVVASESPADSGLSDVGGRSVPDPQFTIEADIWQQLKDWWGPEASVNEIGLLEQQAAVMKISPLALLRHMLRRMIQGGLWG